MTIPKKGIAGIRQAPESDQAADPEDSCDTASDGMARLDNVSQGSVDDTC